MKTALTPENLRAIAQHATTTIGLIAHVHSVADYVDWNSFSTAVPVESAEIAQQFCGLCKKGSASYTEIVNRMATELKSIDPRLIRSPEELVLILAPAKVDDQANIIMILTRVPSSPLQDGPTPE